MPGIYSSQDQTDMQVVRPAMPVEAAANARPRPGRLVRELGAQGRTLRDLAQDAGISYQVVAKICGHQ